MVKLIQFIGPNGKQKFNSEINNFTLPFRNLINPELIFEFDFGLHYMSHADILLNFIRGKHMFDFHPLVKASAFESDVIARFLGVKNVQSLMKHVGKQVDLEIESVLMSYKNDIKYYREYFNKVLGTEGRAKYLEWFESASKF